MNSLPAARLLSIFIFLVFGLMASANTCPSLSSNTKAKIQAFIDQRLKYGSDQATIITSITDYTNCYRKVIFAVPTVSNPVVMYLSPDERFLSSTLYDLSLDQEQEATKISADVQDRLLREVSPTLGTPGQPITIVEFGDFQCPYCKQFGEWYAALPPSLRAHAVLTFKHLPLPQHLWAQVAATYSACTYLQSNEAFWQLANFYYLHQKELSINDLPNKTEELLKASHGVDIKIIDGCVKDMTGAAVVSRDAMTARELNVRSTPTLFLNGRRLLPLQSADALRQLLEKEINKVTPNASLQNTKRKADNELSK
jgi:protein-disulfide isomerase